MDFRPDIDAHLAAKRRQYAKKKNRLKRLVTVILVLTILAIWGLIGFIAYRLMQTNSPQNNEPQIAVTTIPPVAETTPEITVVTEEPKTADVTISADSITRGSLILVSFVRGAEYDFSAKDSFISLYGNKTPSYRISSTALTLHSDTVAAFNEMFDAYNAETQNKDYQITQAARTFDEQKAIYDSYLETYGVEMGSSLAAAPGYSEHHSGYAVDMNVYTADGISYSLGTASDTDPIYGWIYDNAHKYGFILRYPDGKINITGITNEPWHFRYVGKGHATYMTENNLVLEEYIDLLYKYPYDGKHLTFTADGTEYEVFYLAFDGESEKTVALPKDAFYTLSGNNVDGVIVTLTK